MERWESLPRGGPTVGYYGGENHRMRFKTSTSPDSRISTYEAELEEHLTEAHLKSGGRC